MAALDSIRTAPALLFSLSRNAAMRAREFTVQEYGERLRTALAGIGERAAALAVGV